ncbi:MAG: NAD(P)/FAD-dependent oxidoreductase [Pseudomonadota bacterium]
MRTALLVIGAGPAGVAAALQAAALGIEITLVADEPAGGLARAARRIDNLPGLPRISGIGLGQRLQTQLGQAGITSIAGRVRSLTRRDQEFVAEQDHGTIVAHAVVLASGTRPRTVDVEGWDRCTERGLAHRDLRTLLDLPEGKRILVLGGGEVALDTALSLADRGARVAVALRGDRFRARPALLHEARASGVEIWPGLTARRCEPTREGLLAILGGEAAPRTQVEVAHVVACIGREPETQLLRGLGLPGDRPLQRLQPVPGLYLAGDLTRDSQRYIAPALGDGVHAACLAHGYLATRIGGGGRA